MRRNHERKALLPPSTHSFVERQKCVACVFLGTGLFKHVRWHGSPGVCGVLDPELPKANQLLNLRAIGPELLIT